MIYLFDRAKKLQKIIPRKHIINATQTKVRNGIYQLAVEVPIFYETKQGTHYNYQKSVSKAEFAGHYDDKNRFQLYKIYSRNITANEQGEFLLFDGVHIFFDEAKAMGNIHDRRFRDSEAKAPADAAFNSIGWTVIDYDVTDRHDINFYRASVTDAWNDLISTYGVEFDYELQFDGRKIISKNIIMKKQIGKWTGQRFTYGTNVLTLTQEQDESEVYTAAVGRGRGEESGDGFGPRLEFGDIAWSKDGITKPVGQNYIELPSATAEYGFIENGIVKPRIAPEVVFEDIEDKKKLADATYYWLLENCLPKATWKTEVARIGNLKLGDTVGVLYKAAGIIKRARVEKIEYNLLDPELSKLTLGDFHHFENRQMKRINAQIKRLGRDSNDRITHIKNEWNAWIDNQFIAAKNELEQAIIDATAEVEAMRVEMTDELATVRKDMSVRFESEKASAYEEAQRNYDAIDDRITNVVDSTRSEMEQAFNDSVKESKEYAIEQAETKAQEVQSNLETFENLHDSIISDFQNDVSTSISSINSDILGLARRVSTAESKLTVQDDEISSIVGKVEGNTKSISAVVQDAKSIKSTIAEIEEDLVTHGSEINQALNSITGKVWLGDVGGRNLLPKTDLPNDRDYWRERGTNVSLHQTSTRGLTDYLWVNRPEGEANRYIAVLSPLLTENVVEGHEYTIQFKTAHRVNVNEKFTYVYLMNEDGTTNQATYDANQTVIEVGENGYNANQIQLHTISVKANFSGRARILIGTHSVDSGPARFYVKEPKIEKGSATAYARSPEDFLQMSELKITPEYWQLGSTRVDGESVSSVLRGSPDSIDAIVSEMNLTGNLNVKGQIETIAMSAVRGDFAELFAKQVEANVIDVDHISGRTAWFERLYILSTNVNRLTAQHVFTDAVHAKSLDAIEANIGRVRTAFLKADVIEGSHIKSNTIEIKHLTGYDAILEMLMARSVFSNEVTTLSLNAVEANIGSIRSQILTANVIQSQHIQSGNALIDKIFSSTGMFERMMAKSGFVTTLNTVSIDTDQLTIRRADGGVLMSNGTQKFGSPIITKPFPDTGVSYDNVNYSTTLRSSKTFERAYGEHSGRWANFSFRIGLDWSAASASTYMRILIRPGTMPSGVSVSSLNERFIVYRGEQTSVTMNVRLPVPTFGAMSWTLEFYREGDNISNPITIRSERCWVSA